MRRVLGVIGATALAAAALVAGVAAGTGSASVPTAKKATIPTITVTMTDFKFKLSKGTVPKIGKVKFKVVNKGKIGHDFKINKIKTKLLAPGKTQTITVNFKKKGQYAYLCTVTGHAKLGMQGKFAVASKVVTTTTTATTTTSTTTVSGPGGSISVDMRDYLFVMSATTVPQGNVTFSIKNSGNEIHNFDIVGKKAGALLGVNGAESWTVNLAPGTYNIICDVPFHVDRGMVAQLVVTAA
jgi:uncharacterized cupredoxin-like copper-binding protein